jgi:hypothetical protein
MKNTVGSNGNEKSSKLNGFMPFRAGGNAMLTTVDGDMLDIVKPGCQSR